MADAYNHTTSGILGSVQRGLMELNAYLSQPSQAIDIARALDHLDVMRATLEQLAPANPNVPAQGGEARAN